MKHKRRLFTFTAALLLVLAIFPGAALAADTEGAETPPPVTLYPAEVRTSEENGVIRLERVYYLSDADTGLIPKTIEDGGRTLTLANVDWQEANTDYVDGTALAVHYTAVASYTGTATGRSVTGYTVTVDYKGEITKTSVDTVIYTAVFSAENVSHDATHFEQQGDAAKDETPSAVTEPEQRSTGAGGKVAALVIGLVLVLAIVGYGGWRGYQFIRDKKRGYK